MWLAVRCGKCGMWQGREIRKSIATASLKCKFCGSVRKITKKGVANLQFITCEDCIVTTSVVNSENRKLWELNK